MPSPSRIAHRALSRICGLPAPTHRYRVHRGVVVPMRDGVELLADHYAPEQAVGTLLVRSPYGRGFPFAPLYAAAYAARGYHVILQSVRGTFGSGGDFDPAVNEAADGLDTAAWLREQPWYTRSFGTIGLSYLGQTQFALMQDPPPDLAAAVIVVGVHDFAEATWGTGAFTVNDFLGWSAAISRQEDNEPLSALLRAPRNRAEVRRAAGALPLGAAGRALLGDGAPWWERWAGHPDVEDPFWRPYRHYGGLEHPRVPVLLIGGWSDLFLDQTVAQYRMLRDRGAEVALTVGPWTHGQMMTRAAALVLRESLDWLGSRVGDRPARPRPRTRIFVTGAQRWSELPDWPPAADTHTLYIEPGRLDAQPGGPAAPSSFTFDPRRPTPTLGGRLLSPDAGRRRDDALAARPDVLSFTGPALTDDLEVHGNPVVDLAHTCDNPNFDVFVRVSEVDRRGRSRNVSDGFRRFTGDDDGPVRLRLDEIAHRFAAGSRIRLLIAGGSHPRFVRNLGTGEPPADGTGLRASTQAIGHGGASRLLLPVRR